MASGPSPHILDDIPSAIVIHQDGVVVYANQGALHLARQLGYELTSESLQEQQAFSFIAESERDTALQNEQRLLESGDPLQQVPRRFIDAQGNSVTMLGSVVRTQWRGRPALLVIFGPLLAAELENTESEQSTVPAAHPPLSPREREVARLLCAGYESLNIAKILAIKESTVRTHVRAIYRKTQSHSRLELLRKLHTATRV